MSASSANVSIELLCIIPLKADPTVRGGSHVVRVPPYVGSGFGRTLRVQLALQATGLNLEPSASRLKFVLVMNDCVRYVGSSTVVTTVNHSSLSSENRMKFSVITVFSL